jgi:hypothetical protein
VVLGVDNSQRDEAMRTTAPEKVAVEDPPLEFDYPHYRVEPGQPLSLLDVDPRLLPAPRRGRSRGPPLAGPPPPDRRPSAAADYLGGRPLLEGDGRPPVPPLPDLARGRSAPGFAAAIAYATLRASLPLPVL